MESAKFPGGNASSSSPLNAILAPNSISRIVLLEACLKLANPYACSSSYVNQFQETRKALDGDRTFWSLIVCPKANQSAGSQWLSLAKHARLPIFPSQCVVYIGVRSSFRLATKYGLLSNFGSPNLYSCINNPRNTSFESAVINTN